jgi:DNA excision repair protein ERCC-4
MSSALSQIQPVIVIDTREPNPSPWQQHFTSPSIRAKLDCGDYSVCGLEEKISIERKSLSDLLSSLTHQRVRFEKELSRARPYHFFCVIIEASAKDILQGRFDLSCANPRAIWESIATFTIRYCPFIFAGDRLTAAKMTESLLLKFAREHIKSAQAMCRGDKALRQPLTRNSEANKGAAVNWMA